MGGVTSRLNPGIPDISLDLGVGDAVVIEVVASAAKAIGIDATIGSTKEETMKKPTEKSNNCRIFWLIAYILLAGSS